MNDELEKSEAADVRRGAGAVLVTTPRPGDGRGMLANAGGSAGPGPGRDALALALAAVLGPMGDEAWKTLVAALALLGTERFEGWKAIAAGIGVSITRARELADPKRSLRMPVRYGARGVYVTRLGLALWLAHYDAPYGAHASLKEPRRADQSQRHDNGGRSSRVRARATPAVEPSEGSNAVFRTNTDL